MTAVFNIAIIKEGDIYVAKCIDNNVASQWRTIDEAIDNLKEALELYYEDEVDAYETTNIFLSTIKINLPWQKNTQYYQENKLWVVC